MSRIVVGVDGSEHSRAALRWALHEARLRDVPVVAVHTYRTPMVGLEIAPAYVDLRPAAVATLAEEVGKALADVGFDIAVEQYVTEGDAAVSLVWKSHADDLVVVGSRGHGIVASALLGSTSQYVASHATCPVVVVHGSAS